MLMCSEFPNLLFSRRNCRGILPNTGGTRMIICTRSYFACRAISGFLKAAVIALGCSENALAECVTETLLTSGPPYAEYRLKNTCGGPAIVHWTRRSETQIEQGSWDVGACATQDHQYAVGEYNFGDVEFRQGGGDKECLSKEDAAKREKDPNENTPSSRGDPTGTRASRPDSQYETLSVSTVINDIPVSIQISGGVLIFSGGDDSFRCPFDGDLPPVLRQGWTSVTARCNLSRTGKGYSVSRVVEFRGDAGEGHGYSNKYFSMTISLDRGGCVISGESREDAYAVPAGAKRTAANLRKISNATNFSSSSCQLR